jgi:hypothetical protein
VIKTVRTENYNYNFDTTNGYFERWGKTLKDDPHYSPCGPEILDVEISTICNQGCKFCYKANTSKGENMSLETFKKLFSKFPENLTQIAFGIGSIDANPDLWKILQYTRNQGIIPNITINGYRMTPKLYDMLVGVCGAVAVSLYDYDICANAVQELTSRGLKQVNIHCLLSNSTEDKCFMAQFGKETDERLKDLNAIVYLRLKPKGRGVGLSQIKESSYKLLINRALTRHIPIGFDSCSAPSFAEVIRIRADKDELMKYVEPCESCCFSYYINTMGIGFPCSFSEGSEDYKGIDVLNCNDFMKEVWFGEEALKFRNAVTSNTDGNGCRNCPIYNLK